MLAAIASLVGIILGASIQFYFSKYLEQQRHRREIRTKAYTDYLNCVSDHANQRFDRQSNEGRALGARTADAKCRICLYGSSNAIQEFAKFERLGATMNTDEQCDAFVSMVEAMRADSVNDSAVASEDLGLVLLGKGRK